MSFLDDMLAKAKKDKKTLVFPETNDERILEAAAKLMADEIANIVLVGNEEEITKISKEDISKATFIDPASYDKIDDMADKMYELRKHRGMTVEEAKKILQSDNLYFGNMLVQEGLADGMVAGAANSTADVLRPALQILSTAPGTKLVSTCFVMDVPNCDYGHNGTFVFSDCGLMQNPSSEELAEIAKSSAESFEGLIEEKPMVAFLSHSTKGSSKHADVDKVTEAVKLAKESAPDIALDGEMQLDAAIVPSVGKSKAPESDVAGHANVLIFPDLDAGNIGYKLVERLAGGLAIGPITQGIAKPMNDLSRGCSVDDIIGVAAITCIQAQMSN